MELKRKILLIALIICLISVILKLIFNYFPLTIFVIISSIFVQSSAGYVIYTDYKDWKKKNKI